MEYYSGWIALVSFSLWVSVIAFLWALRTGQFSDQNRARFLPLSHEQEIPSYTPPSSRWRMEMWVLLAAGGLVFAAIAAVLFLGLSHGGNQVLP